MLDNKIVNLEERRNAPIHDELGFDPFVDFDVGRFAGKPEPKIGWTVENLVPESGITAFAAVEGGGKSSTLTDLLHAVASEDPRHKMWLGSKVNVTGRSMMVTEEGELAGHLRMFDMGVDFEAVRGRMSVIPYAKIDRNKVKQPYFFGQDGEPTDHFLRLLDSAQRNECKLLIIDPTTYFFRLDLDKDATAAYNAFGWLASYSEQTNMAIITAMHTTKSEKPGADPRSIIRGSQAIQGACRVVMYGRFAYEEERTTISKTLGRKVGDRECIRVQVIKENVKGTDLEPRFLMKPKSGTPKPLDATIAKGARLNDYEDTLRAVVALVESEAEKGTPVTTMSRADSGHSILTAIPSYLANYRALENVKPAKGRGGAYEVDQLVNTLVTAGRIVKLTKPKGALDVPDGPFSEFAIGPSRKTND